MTPGSLAVADLRVATLVGDAHNRCISAVCPAVDLSEQDWRSGPADGPPDLLLIESSGLRGRRGDGGIAEEKVDRAAELISWGEAEGVPTMFWETSPSKRIDAPVELMRRVDHLFVADPEAVASLMEKLDGRRAVELPLAAQIVPAHPPTLDEREHAVGFLARWPAEFSGRMRRQLELILDEALDHGLALFRDELTSDGETLPDRFAKAVVPARPAGEAIQVFQRCRVVIGFDPHNDWPLMVPQVSFDALASGAAVIGPNNRGLKRSLPFAISLVWTRERAAAELKRILGDESEWKKASRLARNTIRHAHTYSHRLASIASVAGFRLAAMPPS